MIRAILCLAAGLLLWPSCAPAAEPREVAAQVAGAIEREYFDPRRGGAIAASLRDAAARGDFDQARNPLELATALTDRLRPEDRHFKVRWSGGSEGADRRLPPRADPASSNFGIRRVEVLPGNLGYLDLRYFADFDRGPATPPARQAIDAALGVLAHADALVIDLRDNGGGSPAMVGYLASAFVAPGADVYNTFHSRQGTRSEAPAQAYAAPRTQLPLYVLTSGRTGSAAEAFAYTLKNAGRATLVGEASGGAANPGRFFPLDDGFSVFVSTGSPVSPVTGGNWEGTGVIPDVAVAAPDALARAQQLALAALVERGAGDGARWPLEALAAAPALPAGALDTLAGGYGAMRAELVEGALQLRQERRPPLRLRPLAPDLFFVEGDPTRRARFERGAGGAVAALELLWVDGNAARYPRDAVAAH